MPAAVASSVTSLAVPHRHGRGPLLALATAASALAAASGAPLAAQTPAPAAAPDRPPDVVFVPTPMEVVHTMLAVTRVGPRDVVYDLGCGDGRIVVTAAKRHGARGVGVDIDPKRIADSRHNVDTSGVKGRVEIRQGDLFTMDLRPATVVTLYLLPRLNVQLRPRLYEQLRPGTRVVSHAFDMGDWEADSTISVDGRTVYYWVMPANVAGRWTVTPAGGRPYTMELEQQYQRARGTATVNGRATPVQNVRLVGTHITLTVNGATLTGRVTGDTMSGGQGASAWQAKRG
ncbi:MAG TPA: class I SAM-dependent methyltransferase [Gemmatimonadaceae bacterium]|nr:class I SAM-dependent methyltransferase [Gemmatimonadaceae bacterium]